MALCYYCATKAQLSFLQTGFGNLEIVFLCETLKDSKRIYFCIWMPSHLESPWRLLSRPVATRSEERPEIKHFLLRATWFHNVSHCVRKAERGKTGSQTFSSARHLLYTAFHTAASAGAACVSLAFKMLQKCSHFSQVVQESECHTTLIPMYLIHFIFRSTHRN